MLEKIQNIFYRPDFFRRQEFTGGQALSFYSLSILFLVLGFSLILIPGAWGVNRFFDSAKWQEQKAIIQSLYPDDLVLTFENGKLSTNQREPVVIPFPEEWIGKGGQPKNLLVIDRDAEISRKSIEARDTFVLASATEMGFYDSSKGKMESFVLAQVKMDKKIEVTNAKFDYWVVERGSVLVKRGILFLMCVLPLLMYIALWVGYIIYSVFGALVVWFAAHIRDHKLRYGQAYASTLYLLPASFVVSLLMSLWGFHIPFLFTLVLFGMAFINFERRQKKDLASGPFSDSKPALSSTPITPTRPDEPK